MGLRHRCLGVFIPILGVVCFAQRLGFRAMSFPTGQGRFEGPECLLNSNILTLGPQPIQAAPGGHPVQLDSQKLRLLWSRAVVGLRLGGRPPEA